MSDDLAFLRLRRGLRVASALVLVLLLLAPAAHPQRSDLDRIRTDITRLRTRLEQVRKQSQTAARDLEEVNLQLGIRTAELDLASKAEARLSEQERITTAEVAELAGRAARVKDDLRTRMVALYQLGGLSYLRMLLSIENDGDPIAAMAMLSYLVSRDARLVTRYDAARQQLAKRAVELARNREDLRQTRAVVVQRRREVAAAYAQKAQVVARLRAEEQRAERDLAALEEKARRLERLVSALSRRQQGSETSLDIRTVQGALDWPLRGKVVEKFGRQRDPKFATFTVNNGLKIEAAPGAAVRAVFAGTVLFSQWFKGYGNLIILDHGNRVFSLYGNVKAPLVTVGDVVATGQTIAGTGESEDVTKGHLYFEIRHDNRPEDPQKWLR